MNVHLSPSQLETLSISIPRREKLFRFAHLIRHSPVRNLVIFSNIEHMRPSELSGLRHPQSAFALAASDPILKDAGLKDDTVSEGIRFFGLKPNELHSFSCDCGGQITNEGMARRVEAIAERA